MTADAVSILVAIVAIALGFLVVSAFYESLATRDVYVGRIMGAARRRQARPAVRGLLYVLTVGVGIPVLVVAWAAILSIAVLVVGSVDRVPFASLIAVAVVGAARVLAYARQRTAQDLSKAIPLALALMLLSGGAFNMEAKLEALRQAPGAIDLDPALIGLLIALELSLRIVTDAAHQVLAAVRRRRGVSSDLGVWRTLWAAVRGRPADAAAADLGEAVVPASAGGPAA